MIWKSRIFQLTIVIVFIIGIGWLSGCAAPAVPKAMVSSSMPPGPRNPYTVNLHVQGGSDTGLVDTPNISNADFAKAIEESIIASGLFSKVIPDKSSDYTLAVTIISVSKPMMGASFTVSMEAAWTLINNASQDVIMRESVKSSSTATMGQAVIAATRLRLAVEGAAQENIRLGLLAVSKLKL